MPRVHIHITGIVQGVGMRPFVYREAVACGVGGWVLNSGDGVHIEAYGTDAALRAFESGLRAHAPAASRIDQILVQEVPEVDTEKENADAGAKGRIPVDAQSEHVAQGDRAGRVHNGNDAPCEPFRIIASEDDTAHTTLVSPDIATCNDCLRELFDPADRRYHYPFINCTNCGPRFTIIRDLPYDRAKTSMDRFPMCPECAREYADPLDRRFHAQPDACFACGPHIIWREPGEQAPRIGHSREASDAIIARCADLLGRGGIVAIKGLGGFHLVCRADSETAVNELRRRKHRSSKPLAIMVRSDNAAEALCHVSEAERRLLTGSARPIVLLERRSSTPTAGNEPLEIELGLKHPAPAVLPKKTLRQRSSSGPQAAPEFDVLSDRRAAPDARSGLQGAPAVAHAVALDLSELGVMLPYTPLQHLLLAACEERGMPALVMTSGNVSGAPIETDDEAAWVHLVEGGLADALLGNDRAILSRFDDSVVRVVDGDAQMVRRARGYAPQPIALPSPQAKDAACPSATGNAESPDALFKDDGGFRDDRSGRDTLRPKSNAINTTDAPCTPTTCILACGPEQKGTLTLTREQANGAATCFVSQHIGDLENAETMDAWHAARTRMEQLFDLRPTVLACDAHPGYLSSQWAREQARATGLPLIEVQHHHAHIASVIAEAAAHGEHDAAAPVIGIALDGTGAGAAYTAAGSFELDGTIWGGEIIIANLRAFERVAHLDPWPLPGGTASIRDPRRNAFALLASHRLTQHPGAQPLLDLMNKSKRELTAQMIERGVNCPLTSSMGRLLDAFAALLGICTRATYEGEPAIMLEAAAARAACTKNRSNVGDGGLLPADFKPSRTVVAPSECIQTAKPQDSSGTAPSRDSRHRAETGKMVSSSHTSRIFGTSPSPEPPSARAIPLDRLLSGLLDGIEQGTPSDQLALQAHEAVARIIIEEVLRVAIETGISTCALSGGVFMNRLLLTGIKRELEHAGLTVLIPRDLPLNDGCIAYGQAAIARARHANSQMLE